MCPQPCDFCTLLTKRHSDLPILTRQSFSDIGARWVMDLKHLMTNQYCNCPYIMQSLCNYLRTCQHFQTSGNLESFSQWNVVFSDPAGIFRFSTFLQVGAFTTTQMIERSYVVMRSLIWQFFSITTIVTGFSLVNSNAFFDSQAVTTGTSSIEFMGTNNELGNLPSTLDLDDGGNDDWNEPIANTSIESKIKAPAIVSIDDCSFAPVQRPRRKQRRDDGFCQVPNAPAMLQPQRAGDRNSPAQNDGNRSLRMNQQKLNSNSPPSQVNTVPKPDRNSCPPGRRYEVCAARFSEISPISLENRPWTEGYDLNPGDQEYCRLCEWASKSEGGILAPEALVSRLTKSNPEMYRLST